MKKLQSTHGHKGVVITLAQEALDGATKLGVDLLEISTDGIDTMLEEMGKPLGDFRVRTTMERSVNPKTFEVSYTVLVTKV